MFVPRLSRVNCVMKDSLLKREFFYIKKERDKIGYEKRIKIVAAVIKIRYSNVT